jgi:hypothetical protein
MWGTDLTSVMTGEGQAAVFVAVDHCSAECVGTASTPAAAPIASRPSSRSGRPSADATGASARTSPPTSGSAMTMVASRSATTSRRRSASSASRARPPSSASPRATAAPSASSGR